MLLSKLLGGTVAAAPVSSTWSLDNVSFNGGEFQNFKLDNNTSLNADGLFFKPDGTKFFMVSANNDLLQEYAVSEPWNIATASFVRSTPTTGSAQPRALFFSSDGLSVYMTDGQSYTVREYSLGSAWNISSFTFVASVPVSAAETSPYGISFKPDGTKMYIAGSNSDRVHGYSLSTPWRVSTATYAGIGASTPKIGDMTDIQFKSDGTKLYKVENSGVFMREYSLSTPWDLTTTTLASSFSLSDIGAYAIGGFMFKDDGTKMYVARYNTLHTYSLGTPWDISTAVYLQPLTDIYKINEPDVLTWALSFKTDGTKMYVHGWQYDNVYEYNLVVPWEIHTASYFQSYYVGTQIGMGVGISFKPDGLRMFMIDADIDSVGEYSLVTAWDVSTASHVQTVSTAPGETSPTDIFFRADGFKMYTASANGGGGVNEFDLGVAWDISTIVWSRFYRMLEAGSIGAVFFDPTGTKMFGASDTLGKGIFEYTLSTPWNVSTATYVQSYAIDGFSITPHGMYFRPDGEAMFILSDNTEEVVYAFDLVDV